MYKNLRKLLCKEINEMDDHCFLYFLARLDLVDIIRLIPIMDFEALKIEADKREKDLEKRSRE